MGKSNSTWGNSVVSLCSINETFLQYYPISVTISKGVFGEWRGGVKENRI